MTNAHDDKELKFKIQDVILKYGTLSATATIGILELIASRDEQQDKEIRIDELEQLIKHPHRGRLNDTEVRIQHRLAALKQPPKKLRIDNHTDEISYWLWCPGCDEAHRITNAWQFDGNIESPTFSPSILVQGGEFDTRCHSFVRDGKWEFLGDCTHKLGNQTVQMVELPKWLAEENV